MSSIYDFGAEGDPTPAPPPPQLTAEEVKAAEAARVQTVLNLAREKKATLVQMAEAFSKAQQLKLDLTAKELAEYIVQIVQPDKPKVEVRTGSPFANLAIGAVAGFLIHLFVEAS